MRALLVLVAVASLSWATDASAYCLSTTCKDVDACEGEEVPGCTILKWKSRCVGYSIHQAGGPGVNSDALDTIVELAFEAWRNVDCGDGQGPGIVIQNLGAVQCGAVEYNKHEGNVDVIFFNEDWSHEGQSHTFALTTTTFDPRRASCSTRHRAERQGSLFTITTRPSRPTCSASSPRDRPLPRHRP